MHRGLSRAIAGACLALCAFGAGAQEAIREEAKILEREGGGPIEYTIRSHPPGAHLLRPAAELSPATALDTAKLLNLHLSTGDVEEAALLSNSPRRRFEVLRDYRESVGEEEFKRVFTQYFHPENQLLGEVAIGAHRLLVWELKAGNAAGGKAAAHIAGQYFVEVEGRYFVDDVPSDARTRLRWILDAYRSGKISR